MTDKQIISECSRQLDSMSRQADRAAELWHLDPNKAKQLVDEVSRLVHGISRTLEQFSK